jgi:hypothetical protein
MTAHPFHRKLARALDRMGGLYTPQDILVAIAEGRMQSFVEGDSWAITQVAKYPRATVLEVLVALGDLQDCRILHDRILDYARDCGIGLVNTFGRRGWIPDAKAHGWKVKMTGCVYQKEL